MKNNIVEKKIKSVRGESLVETLYSTLVISVAFLVMAGGIVAAAKVNSKIKNADVTLDVQGIGIDNPLGDGTVTFSNSEGNTYVVDNVSFYSTEKDGDGNGYIYYEK